MKINHERLKAIIKGFKNKKIIVLGDYYLDEYVETESTEFSPEAPVPRAIIKEIRHIPGAAGNVAVGFAALGADVHAIGVVGKDESGRILCSEMEKRRINTQGIVADSSRITGTFTRIMLKGGSNVKQHVIRLDKENFYKTSGETKKEVKKSFENKLENSSAVFVADYDETHGTGVVDGELLNHVAEMCKNAGVLSVGISRANIENFKNFGILVCNKKEAEGALGAPVKIENPEEASINLLEKNKAKRTIVTLGKDGLSGAENNNSIKLQSFARQVVDVCGAGDSLSAVLTLSCLSGANFEEACEIAGVGAAIAVSKNGTASVTAEEIEKFYDFQPGVL